MDESAEQIAAVEASRRCLRRWFGAVRREQLESAVWPVLVVVAPVDAEHVLEMAAAEHDDPVKALGTKCAYPKLAEGVCVRCLNKVDQTSANRRDETLVVRIAGVGLERCLRREHERDGRGRVVLALASPAVGRGGRDVHPLAETCDVALAQQILD